MLSGSIRPSGRQHSQEARRNPGSSQPAELLFQNFRSQWAFSAVCRGCADCTEHPYSGQETVRGSPADPVHAKWRGRTASGRCSRIFFSSAFRAGSSVFQSFCPGLTLLQSMPEAFPWKKRRFLCTFQMRPPCSSLRSSPASMTKPSPGASGTFPSGLMSSQPWPLSTMAPA